MNLIRQRKRRKLLDRGYLIVRPLKERFKKILHLVC
jgi:hypothetical protein